MLNGLMQNQSRLFATQQQINTGKKTTEFRGVTREAQTLLGAKSLKSRTEGYISTANQTNRKLNTNEVYLEGMRTAADNLKQNLTEALGQENAAAVKELLGQAATMVLGALNANHDGAYIFAGSRSDTRPVAADTLDDLLAAPDAASLFLNDTMAAKSRVGDNVEITYGLLASEVGHDLLASIKALADFNAGPDGPLEGRITPVQRAFLEAEMANLVAATEKLQASISENGLRQSRLETIEQDLVKNRDFLEVFVSDIEDVDLAEAVTRINNDQLALEASYRIIGQLGRLSILNFL